MPRAEAHEALPDHYAVLGVPCDADPAAIKAAWRQRALGSHPDKPGGSDEAFRRVMQAFTVLYLVERFDAMKFGISLRK